MIAALFTRLRESLARFASRRDSPSPLVPGWISGRFPGALRGGALRQQRDYFLYIPARVTLRDRVPLLVMLHGCSQDARSFAQGSRMNEIADEQGFLVLYPQQSLHANALRCWNWFRPRVEHGGGEAAAIIALVRDLARRYPIDRSRVYVAGISAGGAMAAVLAASYGALFAACAIVAGLMYRAADSALSGMRAMRHGTAAVPESVADEAAQRLSRKMGFVPTLVINGTHDPVVHPRNAEQIIRQLRRFAELLGMEPTANAEERRIECGARSYLQRDYRGRDRVLLRSIAIEGLGHAWSGGDARLPFNDSGPPDTSRLVWDFCSSYRRQTPGRAPRFGFIWRARQYLSAWLR